MEVTRQARIQYDLIGLATKINEEIKTLAHRLASTPFRGPPVSVDLDQISKDCSRLNELCCALAKESGSAMAIKSIFSPVSYRLVADMVTCGNSLQEVKHHLGKSLSHRVKVDLSSIDRRHLRVHASLCKEDDRIRPRQLSATECHMLTIACILYQKFEKGANFILTTTSLWEEKRSCRVLCLFYSSRLLPAEALAGRDGAIYIHCDCDHIWGTRERDRGWNMFIQYDYESTPTQMTTRLTCAIEEPSDVGEQITDEKEQRNNLSRATPVLGVPAYANGLIIHGSSANSASPQAESILRTPQNLANTTSLGANYLGSGITDHYAQLAMMSSTVFPASMQNKPMYGFTHIVPQIPMNDVMQGMLGYESRDWSWPAPFTRTTPEADSPWSERDAPAPPYVLSPGTYQIRLEEATRSSPLAGVGHIQSIYPQQIQIYHYQPDLDT